MPKIIRLNTTELGEIIQKVLNEQSQVLEEGLLRIGSMGPEVTKIQQQLLNLKYNIGTQSPDGKFGGGTQNAVKKFQSDNKLTVDGVVGPNTMRILSSKPKMGLVNTFKSIPRKKVVKPVTPKAEKVKKDRGGIKGFMRRLSPNVAQMFFTRPLTGTDFTKRQRGVIYTTIQNSIKRGNRKDRGVTNYGDYGEHIKTAFDNKTGATTKDIITKSVTDPYFQVAGTLGAFTYQLQKDGTYLVSDTYDFSKGVGYTVTKEEIEGLPYLQQMAFVRKKDNLTPYRAARQIAYLEHPDTASAEDKVKINLTINPREFSA